MAFKDLSEFLDGEPPLVLPIRGKAYTFPTDIDMGTWLKLQKLGPQVSGAVTGGGETFAPETEVLSDLDQDEMLGALCGDTLAEMIADGLKASHLKAVLATLMAYHLFGSRDIAEAVWNKQGEAGAPNRATRRSKAPVTSARSRGSHAASTAPKATAEHGVTSSDSGT